MKLAMIVAHLIFRRSLQLLGISEFGLTCLSTICQTNEALDSRYLSSRRGRLFIVFLE
jgi:hypothetical protein